MDVGRTKTQTLAFRLAIRNSSREHQYFIRLVGTKVRPHQHPPI